MNFFCFFCALLLVFQDMLSAEISKLSVSGTATLYKAADILSISIGVETYNQDVKKATQENSVKMQSVISALLNSGLSKNEIQTKNYTVIPQSTPAPKNFAKEWQPFISGYQVRHSVEIRTTQLELLGELIDLMASKGINIIDSITFALKDEESAKTEAIGKAFQQAEAYANTAATISKQKLKNILDLSINSPYANPHFLKAAHFSSESSIPPTPISAREIEVTASVSLVYEISQ